MIPRVFLAMIVLTAVVFTALHGQRTGNYLGVMFLAPIALIYLLLEIPTRHGRATRSAQIFTARIVVSLGVLLMGVTSIYLGFAELISPVTFSRQSTTVLLEAIRSTVGSLGVSMLFWALGLNILFIAARKLTPFSQR